eukprot:TRINITY_DN3798_c0_g1_i1.p1 TRINITY_DN3798_c0_g1~~TRINITY_DN3798_c0_g1_i1.p1  ORF type:complete len:327 (-),score=96.64 TRINITY_DN3798_c0_g1_i1:39-1019(-)
MASPTLVFGLANVGTSSYGVPNMISDPAKVREILTYLKENGVTQLDTARRYGNGTSEEMIGNLHADQEFTIDTKIQSSTKGSHSPEKIRESAQQSLAALQVKKVHVLYLHAPDRSIPLESVLDTMNQLYTEGIFEKFGLSNFSVQEIQEILQICRNKNYIKPTVYQGMYNIFARNGESDLFPLLKKEGISFYAYSPLVAGLLNFTSEAEATSSNSRYGPGSPLRNLYGDVFFKDSFMQVLKTLHQLAEKSNVTKNEIALRWLYHHSQLHGQDGDAILLGASKISQIEANLKDLKNGPLPQDIVEFLENSWKQIQADAPKVDFVEAK